MVLGPRDATWTGTILDVSAGGAHLSIDRRFEIGSLINVSVLLDDVDRVAFVLRVQWVVPEGPDRWRLGGKFHRRLPPADLERILRAAAATVLVQESSASRDTVKSAGRPIASPGPLPYPRKADPNPAKSA